MYELSILSLVALCLVSFIGVPHGSFDGAVAALLGYQSKKKFLIFVLCYTVISIAVIFFWIQASLMCLPRSSSAIPPSPMWRPIRKTIRPACWPCQGYCAHRARALSRFCVSGWPAAMPKSPVTQKIIMRPKRV